LPEQKFVSLKIYDVRGNLVTTLVSKEMEAGYHSVQWNAGNYASGVYFYRFTSGSFISTKRLLLLK
jgi:flagellar hook assembly protein FlgD